MLWRSGGLLRVCVRLSGVDETSRLVDARALLVADVLHRVAEDLHGSQVLLAVFAQDRDRRTTLERDGARLSIRPPTAITASTDETTTALLGAADVVLTSGHPPADATSAMQVRIGPAAGVELDDSVSSGVDPLALRLALLRHRHAEPVSLSPAELDTADEVLRGWRRHVREWATQPSAPMPTGLTHRARSALDDDLDTPAVLDGLDALTDDPAVDPGAKFEAFVYLDRVLALDLARDLGSRNP